MFYVEAGIQFEVDDLHFKVYNFNPNYGPLSVLLEDDNVFFASHKNSRFQGDLFHNNYAMVFAIKK